MKNFGILYAVAATLLFAFPTIAKATTDFSSGSEAESQTMGCPLSQIKKNEAIARNFLRHLWFTNNTERYSEYLADEYVVHDIGERKDVIEPAIEQKIVADRFWEAATNMSGDIDFQIADCSRVATRWHLQGEPGSLIGHFFVPTKPLPIVNIFRIEDGKIVEVWNHRHDIDLPITWFFWIQGFAVGISIALVLAIWLWRTRRQLRNLEKKEQR